MPRDSAVAMSFGHPSGGSMHHDISQSAMVAWLYMIMMRMTMTMRMMRMMMMMELLLYWRFPFEFMISMPILQ